MSLKTSEQKAQEIVNHFEHTNNHFKNEIDRKYALYEVFRDIRQPVMNALNLKITKYQGSNQVVLTEDGKTIYDSDAEGSLKNIAKFKKFFAGLLVKLFQLPPIPRESNEGVYIRYVLSGEP